MIESTVPNMFGVMMNIRRPEDEVWLTWHVRHRIATSPMGRVPQASRPERSGLEPLAQAT